MRETIISEEQERKLLEKLLQEEEDEDGVSESYSKSYSGLIFFRVDSVLSQEGA